MTDTPATAPADPPAAETPAEGLDTGSPGGSPGSTTEGAAAAEAGSTTEGAAAAEAGSTTEGAAAAEAGSTTEGAAAGEGLDTGSPGGSPGSTTDSAPSAEAGSTTEGAAAGEGLDTGSPGGSPGSTTDSTPPAEAGSTTESDPIAAAVAPGYRFEGPSLELGGLMLDAERLSDVHIKIPLGMLNRHGLVAGATGTGKTKTLQLMAEQLSAAGVPVFAADIKGDLSGLATPGEGGDKLLERTRSVGQGWKATGFPVEYFALGGQGVGVPVRVTVEAFGPTLLSKVLGLNDTQESSLGLVFHYAEKAGLKLIDLEDLRAVLQYLVSDQGKPDLAGLGGLSSATAGVILRSLIGFADQGADAFFGLPEFEVADFLATTEDGKGVISLMELPNLQDRPAIFSTFLMWLLAELFRTLPEEGDLDKPKLVFFFDEAHLLFSDASKAFLEKITQTVRLIRSKGVGVFFVTQSPTDVPEDVLAQLGSRVQHQLRVNTPNDAKALKATVNTYPTSSYDDLGKVITTLGIGEAIVTVMNERGAPTPVAWTRLRAPESLMDPTPVAQMEATVTASKLTTKYAATIDAESAADLLAARMAEAQAAEKAEAEAKLEAKRAKAEKPAKRSETRERGGRISDAAWNSADDIAAALAPRGKKQMARNVANVLKSVFGRR